MTVSGKEVDRWFLMSSPIPVIGIVAAYLMFVIKLGPDFMKDRKPLNIKPIIMLYNLYQTLFNFYIVSKVSSSYHNIQSGYFIARGCKRVFIRNNCSYLSKIHVEFNPLSIFEENDINSTSLYWVVPRVSNYILFECEFL